MNIVSQPQSYSFYLRVSPLLQSRGKIKLGYSSSCFQRDCLVNCENDGGKQSSWEGWTCGPWRSWKCFKQREEKVRPPSCGRTFWSLEANQKSKCITYLVPRVPFQSVFQYHAANQMYSINWAFFESALIFVCKGNFKDRIFRAFIE